MEQWSEKWNYGSFPLSADLSSQDHKAKLAQGWTHLEQNAIEQNSNVNAYNGDNLYKFKF